ncbi:MAG: efflux RND transporter periplasmic adaptor subunit [bacterium]
MKGKPRLIILALVLIMISTVSIFLYLRIGSSGNRSSLSVSGNIEVVEVELSFMVAGQLEKRLVSEGEPIKAGQVAATLESTEFAREAALRRSEVQAAQAALAELLAGSRPEEIAQAQASVRRAQARLDELLSGSRPQEVAAAEAAVQRARAEADRFLKEYERQTVLYRKGVISSREFEVTEAHYRVALARLKESEEQVKLVKEGPRREQIEQARETLKEAREHLALVEKGPRRETIDQAKARLKQTQEALALAETRFGYTTLSSPLSGIVLSEAVEPGEHVVPGTPIITVGDLSRVWLRAYIDETDLGRVKVGQRVQVTNDTYPDKVYEGRISFIASKAEFTPKNVQTQKERVKLVYRIKVDIPNPEMELKPGMPVDAQILLGSEEKKGHEAPPPLGHGPQGIPSHHS